MRVDPQYSSVTLVMLGSFNPSIFTPSWFGWNQLIPESIAKNARLEIAHGQLTSFNADWINLEVHPDRFILGTTQSPYVRLCDLTVRIFREKLPHTPLRAIGINYDVHYCLWNFDKRMQLGRLLSPIEPWGDWGKEIELGDAPSGMTSLTMTQVDPEGRPRGGKINVTVGPSSEIEEERVGVAIKVNDHYEFENQDSQAISSEIIKLLELNFDESLKRSDKIIDHVMSLT